MKFLDPISENDFFSSLQDNLKKTSSFENNLFEKRASALVSNLRNAQNCLIRAGLHKEAQMVAVLESVCSDPATQGLDSNKMLKNLEEKGWVFNAEDGEFLNKGLKDLFNSLSDKQQKKVVDHLNGKEVKGDNKVEPNEDTLSKGLLEMLDSMSDKQQKLVKEFLSDSHEADSCMAEDCSMCQEGKEPQLSQKELKKLRNLLKSE